jgi:protein TonB
MTETGFFEQRSARPGGLALVIMMHAAAFAGLVLIKTDIARTVLPSTDIFDVRIPEPTQEPPPERQRDEPRQPSRIDTPPPIVRLGEPQGPIVRDPPLPPVPPGTGPVGPVELAGTPELPPPPMVRVEAQFDPRFAADQQPPYPPSELHSERDGTVRIRLRIGSDGRVKAIERLSATADSFWRVTERHALARWRFRPATLDGRAVESTKLMTVFFRIEA